MLYDNSLPHWAFSVILTFQLYSLYKGLFLLCVFNTCLVNVFNIYTLFIFHLYKVDENKVFKGLMNLGCLFMLEGVLV